AVAIREGRETWRGENCCAVPGLAAEQACECGPGCTDACCAPEKASEVN
ncbi:MAG: cation transporter, partial [Candidatus Nephthysia bennettiae]